MDKSKKILLIITIALVSILLITGISYAALSYTKTGETQELIVGDIWMKYTESTKIINIENMMPSEEYPNSYFEFEVTGKNTYDKKDIYYEILLDNGEYTGSDTNRTIPIDSQMLRFKLVEVVDGSEIEIFDNRAYSDISNKRIWVDTIGASDGNYSKTYRLYARIYEHTKICSGQEEYCDYYVNPGEAYKDYDWDKLYASIKVSVKGDLEEKSIETDGSCFSYSVTSIENPIVNPVMASQEVIDNELTRCSILLKNSYYSGYTDSELFCKGDVGNYGMSFQNWLDEEFALIEDHIEELILMNIVIQEGEKYFVNPIMKTQEYNELTKCVNVFGYLEFDEGTTVESYCQGSGTLNGNTLQTSIDNEFSKELINELASNNIIKGTTGIISITEYNESCGSDVVIPREIDGYVVNRIATTSTGNGSKFQNLKNVVIQNNITEIGKNAFAINQLTSINIPNSVKIIEPFAFYSNYLTSVTFEENSNLTEIGANAFLYNQLSDVKIPDSVTTIGGVSFFGNKLKNIIIPDSVIKIGGSAFKENQLKTVTIGNGIQYIDAEAFGKNLNSNPDLESITFKSKTCEEIKNMVATESSTNKYFPWLYKSSPYYLDGYKADIIGTDGVCNY